MIKNEFPRGHCKFNVMWRTEKLYRKDRPVPQEKPSFTGRAKTEVKKTGKTSQTGGLIWGTYKGKILMKTRAVKSPQGQRSRAVFERVCVNQTWKRHG